METDMPVVKAVRSLGASDAAGRKYDEESKRLLADRQVLSRVVCSLVPGFTDLDVAFVESECLSKVSVMSTPVGRDDLAAERVALSVGEDSTVAEGTVTFDVRTTLRLPGSDEVVLVELDLESQQEGTGLPYLITNRAVFYVGRMLSAQGGDIVENSRYDQVRRVVGIWVISKPYAHMRGTVTRIHLTADSVIGEATWPEDKGLELIDIFMVCLDDLHPGESEGVCGMLEVILSDAIHKEEKIAQMRDRYGMIVTREIDERVSEMSRLSEGIFARGLSEGVEIGEAKAVAGYMATTGCDLDEALVALRIDEADRPAVIEALRGLDAGVTA